MKFLELAKKRYSIRDYQNKPVEEEKLKEILEAARLAPTGANRQAFQLIVVHTAGKKEEELRAIYKADWFLKAPIFICACATETDGQPYREAGAHLNVAIAVDHLVMAATDLGLGTCWIGAYDRDAIRKILGIPENVHPVILVAVGYAEGEPRPKTRKPIEELMRYEHW
ncbi:MAG TPA: nitroreductase family protein [Dehalococcoidales bacterium]|nr:nitroreductase family protein [Dehalococcoidales bacterium]